MHSCRSNESIYEDVQEYQSFAFNFIVSYPKSWEISETGDGVMLSNDINNLIRPEDQRLQNKGEFLVKINIIENPDMVNFITTISQLTTSDTVFYMDDLLNLFDNILEKDKAKISQQYQELFLRVPSYQIKFLPINNGVIIGDMIGNEYNIKVLYVLKLLQENYLVFEEIMFNDVLFNGNITAFVGIANSVKIDYNIE